MNTFQALHNLVTIMENNDNDKKMYDAVKEFLNRIPAHKNKHILLECFNYISTNISFHLCKHPHSTSVHHAPEGDGSDYDIETCDVCGIQRYVWYSLTNEGYGQFSPSITKGFWEYPKTLDKIT